MRKYIKLLVILMLAYAAYFHLIPAINIAISFKQHFAFFKNIIFWNELIQLFIFLFCGFGLLRLNRSARLIWLIFSGVVFFFNIFTIQMLIQGNFIMFKDLPFLNWVKIYGLFGLLFFSIIFLNLRGVKALFRTKTKPTVQPPKLTNPPPHRRIGDGVN